jgi:hypothetical protein
MDAADDAAMMPVRDHLEQQIKDIRRAAEIALSASHVEGVPLREYLEALLAEKERALQMANGERELSAAALRGEQQRAVDQATSERDKAAEKLQVELARSIHEGDERLREHIGNQIDRINADLVSAEKLELARVERVEALVVGLTEQRDLLAGAASDRQDKFEISVSDRFTQVNEFRGALDDMSKTMATRRELEAGDKSLAERIEAHAFQLGEMRSRLDRAPAALVEQLQGLMPREVFESKIGDLEKAVDARHDANADAIRDLTTRMDLNQGHSSGVRLTTGVLISVVSVAVALIGLLLVVLH